MFQPLAFLDVSNVIHAYVGRGRKIEVVDEELLSDSKPIRSLVGRIVNGAAPFFGGRPPVLHKAAFERYHPDMATPWRSPKEGLAHVTVCLIPSPGLWHYSGGVGAVLPVGQVTAIPHRGMASIVNFGAVSAVHLRFELKGRTDDAGGHSDRAPDADPEGGDGGSPPSSLG